MIILAKKSKRRIVRERALQVLYAFKMNGGNLDFLIDAILTEVDNPSDKKFGTDLINRVLANRDVLEKEIMNRVTNWELDRIAVLDKILLQMGFAEILFFPDIPPKVSINEVIEIAKEYSTSNSGKFINGILDSFLSELKNQGNLNKTGRGLIDDSFSPKLS
jgi:N utilization substance protein B